MQTTFTNKQLKDQENKSSEQIIRKCVHCGMCNATCPTFNILGDDLFTIKAIASGTIPGFNLHLASNLSSSSKLSLVKIAPIWII